MATSVLEAATSSLESLDQRASEIASPKPQTAGEADALTVLRTARERLERASSASSRANSARSERSRERERELLQLREEAERVRARTESERESLALHSSSTSSSDCAAMRREAQRLIDLASSQREEASQLSARSSESERQLIVLQKQREQTEASLVTSQTHKREDDARNETTNSDSSSPGVNALEEEIAAEHARIDELARTLSEASPSENNSALRQQLDDVHRELNTKRAQAESLQHEKETLERKINRLKQQQQQQEDEGLSIDTLRSVPASSSSHSQSQSLRQQAAGIFQTLQSSVHSSWGFVVGNAYARSSVGAYICLLHFLAFLLMIPLHHRR
jgi:predicted  nucleic acid-binding Zn-ribbon protein